MVGLATIGTGVPPPWSGRSDQSLANSGSRARPSYRPGTAACLPPRPTRSCPVAQRCPSSRPSFQPPVAIALAPSKVLRNSARRRRSLLSLNEILAGSEFLRARKQQDCRIACRNGIQELLLEIVLPLTVTAGLSDLTLRDVGFLGLAFMLTGPSRQRLTLTPRWATRRVVQLLCSPHRSEGSHAHPGTARRGRRSR